MFSVRQQIRDLVVALLNAERPIEIPEVTARRWLPAETDVPLSIACIFINEQSTRVGGRTSAIKDNHLLLGVQVVAGSNYKDFVDDLVEPALHFACDVLAGGTDLEGLVTDIVEDGTTWEAVRLDKYYLAATVRFRIRYQTARNDTSKTQ